MTKPFLGGTEWTMNAAEAAFDALAAEHDYCTVEENRVAKLEFDALLGAWRERRSMLA